MKVYVLRHGETCMNSLNQVCGISNVALSEKGKSEAFAAAEKLKQKLDGTKIDAVYVSPLLRAQETAQAVQTILSKNGLCPTAFVTDGRLTEQDYGDFEGKNRLDKAFEESKRQFADKSHKQETLLAVAYRVYDFLEDLKRNKDQNGVVLVVTHGAVCRMIHSYFNSMTNEEFGAWRAVNCQLDEYEL